MASYFDSTPESQDLLLLPESMRKSQEIANIATVAERDVIAKYTTRSPRWRHGPHFWNWGFGSWYGQCSYVLTLGNQTLTFYVWLLGYKEDADDADVDPDLKQALKDTIADVVAWRVRNRLKDPTIMSESTDDGKTVTYNDQVRSPLPPDFDWRLLPFSVREPAWGI